MKKNYFVKLVLVALSCFTIFQTNAQMGIHDPSNIIYADGRYYIFGTGDGIYMASSTSSTFDSWTIETSPFASGNPSWISSYVSDFGGTYWAPEIIYMNSKYYLYYSVSMGERPCAIGLVTTPSLSNPEWTDQGMVVYSDNSTVYGSIDPDVFYDQSGRFWLAYGSHLTGIALARLGNISGKPLNTTRYNIVTSSDAEAAHLEYYNGYYYVFYNQNICCAGLESSYAIYMGRSTSIAGPYYDKDGVSLNDGGGSLFLGTNGRYVGAGHFGLGEDKLTYHFYDGNDYGYPKLMVSTLSWEDGWPVAEILESDGSEIDQATYQIVNRNSGSLLEAASCGTDNGTNVQQYSQLDNDCQKWVIKPAYEGFFYIENRYSGLVLEASGCGFFSGTNAQLYENLGNWCQMWSFISMGDGYYRIVNRANGKDLEVADASTSDGANVQLWGMNGSYCQQWYLEGVGEYLADGIYTFTNRTSSKVLDLNNCDTSDGANIQQYTSLDNECQQWQITRKDNGYYTIQNVYSSKMLDVVNCGSSNGTNVDQWSDLDNTCQEWYFSYVGDTYFRIINNATRLNVEVADASTSDGANVQMYANNNAYCQHWGITYLKSAYASTDIEDMQSDVRIYPNPVKDILNIDNVGESAFYEIYNLDGSLVTKTQLQGSQINVSGFAAGVYLIKIESNDDNPVWMKFVKQ